MAPSVMYLSKNQTLRTLYATDGNKILAIAPLRKSRRSFNGLFSYNVIEPLASGNTDYTGIILSEHETECLQMFLKHLFKQKDWDFIYLHDIPETSTLLNLFKKNHDQFPNFTVQEGIICPYLTLPDSTEELLSGLSARFRKNLRRSLRKLEHDQGKVELKEYQKLGSLEETMQILFDVHQKRWETLGEPGAFKTQWFRDMFLASAKLFAEKDWLRLYFLTADDKPTATLLAFEYNQKMYANIYGFNPIYSAYGVGNLTTMKVLERCIEKKIKEFDFMQGDEPYKFRWTTKYRRNFNIQFVNNKPTSKLIRLGIQAVNRTKLRGLLKRFVFI